MYNNGIKFQYPKETIGGLFIPAFKACDLAVPDKEVVTIPKKKALPNEDNENNSSPWIQLIGVKVVKRTDQQEIEHPWFMIGINYVKPPGGEGYISIYLNGEVACNHTLAPKEYINFGTLSELYLKQAKFSCIEVSNEEKDETYFKDFNLNECSKYCSIQLCSKLFNPPCFSL